MGLHCRLLLNSHRRTGTVEQRRRFPGQARGLVPFSMLTEKKRGAESRTPAIRPKQPKLPPFEPPTPERSRHMAAIRARDTRLELAVRRAVHKAGFRFRLHPQNVPGRPDFVLPRYRVAALVHGCFWHGHSCPHGHIPRTNTPYWTAKIARNLTRDARAMELLDESGWRPAVVWECSWGEDTARLIERLNEVRAEGGSGIAP